MVGSVRDVITEPSASNDDRYGSAFAHDQPAGDEREDDDEPARSKALTAAFLSRVARIPVSVAVSIRKMPVRDTRGSRQVPVSRAEIARDHNMNHGWRHAKPLGVDTQVPRTIPASVRAVYRDKS
jgi:hypothetical protein